MNETSPEQPADTPNPPELPRKRKAYIKNLGCLCLVLALPAYTYLTRCTPLTRMGPRNFVMWRDYDDMKKIFRLQSLPDSFDITNVRYPGGYGMTDGPAPAVYRATVAGADYPALVTNIADCKSTMPEYDMTGMSAVREYNNDLAGAVLIYEAEKTITQYPDMFDVPTTTPLGRARETYIVADIRSSSTVEIYITTKFPYDG